jgi:hypothetical protein
VKSPRWSWCAFVLASLPSLAFADEPSLTWAKHRVDEGLVKPIAAREKGGTFSRGRPPPRQSRVRTPPTEQTDASKRVFASFAIDVRFGNSEWHENDVVGCVYKDSGQIFVRIADEYRPAAYLLGKNVDAVKGVCEAAPPSPPARS